MEPVVVKENEPAVFRVEFEANPAPVVKWLRYTFEMKNCEEIMIDNQETCSTMTIKNACTDDGGIFTCLLENPAGATKSSTNLTVLEASNATIVEKKESQSMSKVTTSTSKSMSQSVSKSSVIQQSQETVSKTMHVKRNDKIRIDIQFKDGTKSDLTFTHNGQKLEDSNKDGIEITVANDIATLSISNAEPKHSGTYQCIMKTEGGEARCTINCNVE